MDCVHCTLPIEGAHRGAGVGTGQRFAHEDCYWRNEATQLATSLVKAKQLLNIVKSKLPCPGRYDWLAEEIERYLND